MRWIILIVVLVVAFVLVRKFLTAPLPAPATTPPDWVGNKPVPIAVASKIAPVTDPIAKALTPLGGTFQIGREPSRMGF